MTSQAFHILPDCHGHAQLADNVATIKVPKMIRGSLEAAFELTKVFRCSMVLRSYKRNQILC